MTPTAKEEFVVLTKRQYREMRKTLRENQTLIAKLSERLDRAEAHRPESRSTIDRMRSGR
jgi:PHD/YefM family antitoxin component YafN of YafNO toxin-antitoxin module